MKSLTPLQREVLHQLVSSVQQGTFTEEFFVNFPMGPPGTHVLISTDGKRIKLKDVEVSPGIFDALADAGLLVCYRESRGMLRCVLLGQAFDAVNIPLNRNENLDSVQNPIQDIDQTMLEYLQYLHPYIKQGCTSLFVSGHYTQAVEESVKAVFSYIREKTGKSIDGTTLVEQVFSLKNPLLQFNDLSDQTKQNEQLGFMEMLKGYFRGVRHPLAHTHGKQEDKQKAFEYLTMASLFCRRIDDATINTP